MSSLSADKIENSSRLLYNRDTKYCERGLFHTKEDLMKQPYNTALYMRLSRDDENFGDSVSIETQRTILQQYARDNNLHVVSEFVDDGWSGTNFDEVR